MVLGGVDECLTVREGLHSHHADWGWEESVLSAASCDINRYKGTTINDLGVGPEEIEKKKLEALLQEKIFFERHSPGKKIYGRGSREK